MGPRLFLEKCWSSKAKTRSTEAMSNGSGVIKGINSNHIKEEDLII